MTVIRPPLLRHPALTEEQSSASDGIDRYIGSNGDVLLIGGAAGTGKTFLAQHIARRYRDAILAAPTNLIARKLTKAVGRSASTLHRLLYIPLKSVEVVDGAEIERLDWLDNEQPLDSGLVFIDEASLVPQWIARDLLERGARIVAFGDHHQLPPVNADPFFTRPDIELKTIHRQASNSGIIRQAHRILRCLPYQSDGEFQVVDRIGDHLDWADAIIAWKNKTRLRINREMRWRNGIDPHAPPRRGEPLICVFTDHRNSIVNGEMFEVVEDYRPGHPLVLHGAAGIVEVGKPHIEEITTGEASQEHTQFALGYCLTAHKAQGLEWPNVLILDEGIRQPSRCPWMYTAATRGIEEVKIGRKL